MSQIPRKTSEFQFGSARKSTRPSRGAYSRPSAFGSTNNRPSSSNARPSTRISAATPQQLRTPLRTPRSASRDRNTIIPMTAEKEKAPVDDREVIQQYIAKLLDELANIGGCKELTQKGFKSMTTKQFIAILQHFLTPIYGNMPDDFASTYIDRVPEMLNELEYPYTINKSNFKTPSALHCLNNTIVLLSWLQDFSAGSYEDIIYEPDDNNTTVEQSAEIMNEIAESFNIWNATKHETEHCLKKVVQVYRRICLHTDPNLTIDITHLKGEIEQLKDNNKPLTLAKELSEKKEDLNKLELKIGLHEENIAELIRKIENAKAELSLRKNEERSVSIAIKRLRDQLSRQEISKDDRHKLLMEITHMKSSLNSKKNAVLELRETSNEKEILLSNLISKKFQLIEKLNNMIYKIASEMEIYGIKDVFDVDDMALVSSKDCDKLDHDLNKLSRGLQYLKENYINTLSAYKKKFMKLESENNQLTTQNDLKQSKLTQKKSTLQQLTIDEHNIEMEYKSFLQNTQTEHYSHKENLASIEKEIEERNKGIEQLELDVEEIREKKITFGSKAIAESERLYEERKREVEKQRIIVNETTAAIESYKRNKKPLPENLQKLLSEILQERAMANAADENKENI